MTAVGAAVAIAPAFEKVELGTPTELPADIAFALNALNVLPVVGGLIALSETHDSSDRIDESSNYSRTYPTMPAVQCTEGTS